MRPGMIKNDRRDSHRTQAIDIRKIVQLGDITRRYDRLLAVCPGYVYQRVIPPGFVMAMPLRRSPAATLVNSVPIN